MKRTKLFSVLMLMSVLAFSVMSFATRLVDFHCYSYTGTYPVDDTKVITEGNYTRLTPANTALTCPVPRQVYCGFCIYEDSPYWDAVNNKPLFSNGTFQSLFQSGSPTEVYNDTSLHGTELGGTNTSRIFIYFRSTP